MKLLLLLVLCQLTPAEDVNTQVHSAGTIVYLTPEAAPPTPGPTPDPTPQPGSQCEKCGGTGKVYPDGRIERPCPQCGGDGIVGAIDRPIQEQLEAFELGLTKNQLADAKRHGKTLKEYAAIDKRLKALEDASRTRMREMLESTPQAKPMQRMDGDINIKWLKDPEDGWKESRRTGKPTMIYWTGENCEPCRRMDSTVFADDDTLRYIAENFVCVKVDVETFPAERRKTYGVNAMPRVSVIPADWKNVRTLKHTFDPDKFVDRLHAARQWAKASFVKRTSGQRTPFRLANIQEGDLNLSEIPDVAEGLETEESWSEPIPETTASSGRVEPVQYIIVQGGAGSSGGRYGAGSNGGGASQYYAQPAQYYGNGGGGYYSAGAGAGSAGGGAAMYYPQQNYGYGGGGYSRPMYSGWGGGGWGGGYSGGWGGGGGTMVCGPNGCYMVQ